MIRAGGHSRRRQTDAETLATGARDITSIYTVGGPPPQLGMALERMVPTFQIVLAGAGERVAK